jgi:carboxypeptidase Q
MYGVNFMRSRTALTAGAALFLAGLISIPDSSPSQSAKEQQAEQSAARQAEQPYTERIDLSMYQRIMNEGFNHSRIMEYASALVDDIGERLTGSPNALKANNWARDQFTAMGCANSHLESWGDFGQGWQQLNTWVRMVSPDIAVFIAQAQPWTPSTNGPVTGDVVNVVINRERDMEQYKGKLAGKIVLFGPMRPVPHVEQPLWTRLTDEQLDAMTKYPRPSGGFAHPEAANSDAQVMLFLAKVDQFFADEHVAAVILPSRPRQDGGASGGTFVDDYYGQGPGASMPGQPGKVPVVKMAIENYGRMYRLLQANVPVRVQIDVETKFFGEQQGYNTIAEISGTDPDLKDQVVMLGGHLDSWAAGTGATDNGAGTVVTMEAMRILTALHVHPRRTIRAALWTGEEEGELGSLGYARKHLGVIPLDKPEEREIPVYLRSPSGPLTLKPDQKLISVYFNYDDGSGRIRGIQTEGDVALVPIFEQWIAPLKNLGVTAVSLRSSGATDNINFDAVGIPGLNFIQDPLDYNTRSHHTNMDVYEELSPDDLKQAAVVEAVFVYDAAMRDELLPRNALVMNPTAPIGESAEPTPLPGVFPDATPAAKPH